MSNSPPVAPARPAAPGADPYAWMRDSGDPDQQVAHTAALRDMLTAEMTARVAPAAESASWHRGDFAYFTRNVAGLEYEQFCRRPAHGAAGAGSQQAGGPPAEVLLDPNLLLEDPECGG